MLNTVRGVFREGRVELQEAPPRLAGRVLVIFLGDEPEDLLLEADATDGIPPVAPKSPARVIDAAWPRELVDQLMAAPEELIERNQPSEAERKDLGL
jgi:hypothetical protein